MIDHISFTVRNLNKSVEFYSKAFGMKVIREWKRENEGLTAKIIGNDGALIELIESKNPKQIKQDSGDMNQLGFTHIAFSITNIEETIQKLIKLGGKIIRGPEIGKTVKKWAFVEDLDRITIELVEI